MNKEETLIPAICPQCGAKIQLASNLEVGYCNYCGTQIIVKDVIQKVKIVNNPTLENYIKIADRAYDDKDYEKALESYKKALEIDPDNWKVNYREGICTANTTNLARFDIDKAVVGSKNAIKLMNEQKIDREEIAKNSVLMAIDLIKLNNTFTSFAMNHYNEYWELDNSAEEMWSRIIQVKNTAEYITKELLTDEIIKVYPKDSAGQKTENWKLLAMKQIVNSDVNLCIVRKYKSGYNQYGDIYSNAKIKNEIRVQLVQEYDKYVALIKDKEANYQPPQINRDGKAQGCYVATCVYGSYDCPEVWVLRRYRDYKLSTNWYGRLFIYTYYFISPKLVKVFGEKEWFKNVWRKKIDKIVDKLRNEGYENTPYKDREW